MPDLVALAARLRALHRGPDLLILPNAWDAATARIVEEAGFPAVATSSAAVAKMFGEDDHDSMAADLAFAAVARVTRAVSVPVTADLEAGYQLEPREFVDRLLAAGAVGCNIEDTDHHGGGVLVEAEAQAQRLQAMKDAGRAAGVDIVLNARTDVFLRQLGSAEEQEEEIVRRAALYLEAGADCVYPIAVADEALVRRLVTAIAGPVNIMLRLGVPSLATLKEIGVIRVSAASGLHKLALSTVKQAAEGLRAGDIDALWPA